MLPNAGLVFRLHEDGRFYDVPVAGNETRYHMNSVSDSEIQADARRRLSANWVSSWQSVKPTRPTPPILSGRTGDNFKNAQDKART